MAADLSCCTGEQYHTSPLPLGEACPCDKDLDCVTPTYAFASNQRRVGLGPRGTETSRTPPRAPICGQNR